MTLFLSFKQASGKNKTRLYFKGIAAAAFWQESQRYNRAARQHCRDKATMLLSQKTVGYGSVSLFFVSSLFRHPGLRVFVFFLVSEAPLHFRFVVVAKLKNCRVPALLFYIFLLVSDSASGSSPPSELGWPVTPGEV